MQINELTDKQSRCIDAMLGAGGKVGKASKLLGQTSQYVSKMMAVPRVRLAYEHREQMSLKFVDGAMSNPVVTKTEIARMFLDIANAGTERGFDKEGNSIMINPGSANTALSSINKMYGYDAPVEVVHTKVERTEVEIVANVQALQTELNALLALDADSVKNGHDSVTIDTDIEDTADIAVPSSGDDA